MLCVIFNRIILFLQSCFSLIESKTNGQNMFQDLHAVAIVHPRFTFFAFIKHFEYFRLFFGLHFWDFQLAKILF